MSSRDESGRELRIGLVGLGAMGGYVAEALLRGEVPRTYLLAAADPSPASKSAKEELTKHAVPLVESYEAFLDYPVDLVVECANQSVARGCASFFVSRGIDVIIMSMGALVDVDFLSDLSKQASQKSCRILVPSGAIGAIDALSAAKLAGLDEVSLTTRKPPASLGDVDGVDFENLMEPRVIYDGTAREAVAKFPKNVNVAATISLAGLGFDKTKVQVVADPTVNQNIHEIRARGAFGTFEIRLANMPSPQNPKTSFLSCASVLALLKKIQGDVQIGS